MKYFHIASFENVAKITMSGLLANEDGQIFLFENESFSVNGVVNSVADCIAHTQVFLPEYVILEIDSKGLNVELIKDNVGEFSARWQWIANQPLIEKKYIKLVGRFKTKYKTFF